MVVVIRYLAERTSRVDRDGIRYTLFGQPVYRHSINDVLRHRSGLTRSEETAHLVYEFHPGLDRTVYDLRL